jgi:hypothetical protein
MISKLRRIKMIFTKKRITLTFCVLLSVVFFGPAFAQITKPDLKLVTRFLSPAGGEEWIPGTEVTIKWMTDLSKVDPDILILRKDNPDGGRIGTIARNIASNVTSIKWKVGETLQGMAKPGSGYFMRLKYTENGEPGQVDSQRFSIGLIDIRGPRISVTVPTIKTQWWNGKDPVYIKWTTRYLSIDTKVIVALWDEEGENEVKRIGLGSKGEYQWKVPATFIPGGEHSRTFRVKLTQYEVQGDKKPIYGLSAKFKIYFMEPPS